MELEKDLNNYNSKTCDVEKFKEYLIKKNEINNNLFNLYTNEKFRQYKWYSYINTKKSETKMLNLIESKYGKDVTIIYGDWSQGKQMRNYMSTPNLGIKRKIAERFTLYNIDEYRSSCLHYKTEKRCKNIKLKDANGKSQKIHSVLTYKMENQRIGCINRDYNACVNLLKIYKHFLNTNGERLTNYSRSVKKPTHTLKDVNLISSILKGFVSVNIVRDRPPMSMVSCSSSQKGVQRDLIIPEWNKLNSSKNLGTVL